MSAKLGAQDQLLLEQEKQFISFRVTTEKMDTQLRQSYVNGSTSLNNNTNSFSQRPISRARSFQSNTSLSDQAIVDDYVYGTNGKTHVESKAVGDDNDWHSVDIITYQDSKSQPPTRKSESASESSNEDFLNIGAECKRRVTIQNNVSSYLRYSSVAPPTYMRPPSADLNPM